MDEDEAEDDNLVFDPRILLSPPIIDCPKCKEKGCFGVDRVAGNSCTKRCVCCQYSERADLPQLKKKIIYIDQFAISGMAKAVLSGDPGGSAPMREEFWFKLFRVLNGLCRLQLIVCPTSELHTQESEVDSRNLDFGRIYRTLSGELHFEPFLYIRQKQFLQHVKKWRQGTPNAPLALCAEEITGRALHDWWQPNRLIIQFPNWPKVGTETRKLRQDVASDITIEFGGLAGCNGFDFLKQFRANVKNYAEGIIRGCRRQQAARDLLAKGLPPADVEDLCPSAATMMAEAIVCGLSELGESPGDCPRLLGDYLVSDSLEYVPFIRISSMLYAAQARKFASGRKKPVGSSGVADFDMIATLLPYCDTMFLDRECCGLLSEEPLISQLGYPCKVFSAKQSDEFLCFLTELGRSVSCEHIAVARSVYGPGIDRILELF